MSDTSPTADYRKEQADEYGEFVALEQIYWNGALAYNPGDPVPKSNVELRSVPSRAAGRFTRALAPSVCVKSPPRSLSAVAYGANAGTASSVKNETAVW